MIKNGKTSQQRQHEEAPLTFPPKGGKRNQPINTLPRNQPQPKKEETLILIDTNGPSANEIERLPPQIEATHSNDEETKVIVVDD